jgi:predicted small lipoprotein YifL
MLVGACGQTGPLYFANDSSSEGSATELVESANKADSIDSADIPSDQADTDEQ